MTAPRLSVRGLSLTLAGRTILRDVHFALPRGQTLGLLGPNGAGKSSVLRALLGLVPASCAAFCLDGSPFRLGAAAVRRRLGVVPQASSLDGKLSVLQNLHLGGRLYGLGGAGLAARAAEMLAWMELTDRQHARVEQLSGGQRRRLELVRALLHRPDILVLDEPTQGLDPAAEQRIWRGLEAAQRAGQLTILLSSHSAQEAARCHQVLLLMDGQVLAHEPPAALLARVAGQIVTLELPDAQAVQAGLQALAGEAELTVRGEQNRLIVRCAHAPAWVPRLVDRLGAAQVRSVHLRPPALADVFGTFVRPAAAGPQGHTEAIHG